MSAFAIKAAIAVFTVALAVCIWASVEAERTNGNGMAFLATEYGALYAALAAGVVLVILLVIRNRKG